VSFHFYLYRAEEGLPPINQWTELHAEPLGSVEQVKATLAGLFPQIRWERGSGAWLGSGAADDLARIRGIDAPLAARLNEVGITSYGDIDRLSDADAADLERRLGLRDGTVARDEWREQARLLAAGRDADWHGRYG